MNLYRIEKAVYGWTNLYYQVLINLRRGTLKVVRYVEDADYKLEYYYWSGSYTEPEYMIDLDLTVLTEEELFQYSTVWEHSIDMDFLKCVQEFYNKNYPAPGTMSYSDKDHITYQTFGEY